MCGDTLSCKSTPFLKEKLVIIVAPSCMCNINAVGISVRDTVLFFDLHLERHVRLHQLFLMTLHDNND